MEKEAEQRLLTFCKSQAQQLDFKDTQLLYLKETVTKLSRMVQQSEALLEAPPIKDNKLFLAGFIAGAIAVVLVSGLVLAVVLL